MLLLLSKLRIKIGEKMEILVAKMRVYRNITQEQLALYAGINQQKISRIEHGYEPKISVGLKIARGLSVPVESIFVLTE